MSRILHGLAALWLITGAAQAQDFSGLARIDAAQSAITDQGKSVQIDLHLSQGVPYRLFTLDNPPRLVLDFQEIDWSGLLSDNLQQSERIQQVQFGTYVPGWSRMVIDLGAPMQVAQAGTLIDQVTGAAHLSMTLTPVTAEMFAEQTGAPRDARWDLPDAAEVAVLPKKSDDAPLVVVLDPGHGGIDPGAERDSIAEKDLMLTFARELREILLRSGWCF